MIVVAVGGLLMNRLQVRIAIRKVQDLRTSVDDREATAPRRQSERGRAGGFRHHHQACPRSYEQGRGGRQESRQGLGGDPEAREACAGLAREAA
jgi:hypothetical protein